MIPKRCVQLPCDVDHKRVEVWVNIETYLTKEAFIKTVQILFPVLG